ncbi:Methyltransferase TRM13 [Cryptosporidium felis]|nr:Methyltransferase TRM13 [Cryptosporidium felis]
MNTESENCSFFLRSKSRYCKYPKCENSNFCILHDRIRNGDINENLESFKDSLVPCYIDSKHYVSASKIRHHIKRCSRVRDIAYVLRQPFCKRQKDPPQQQQELKRKIQKPFSIENIKASHLEKESPSCDEKDELFKIKLELVDKLHEICTNRFGENPHFDLTLSESFDNYQNKHEKQAISIAREFMKRFTYNDYTEMNGTPNREYAVENDNSLVVEFGAGNAILSYWFIKECNNPESNEDNRIRSVIIDRESRRKQFEKLELPVSSLRLRLDIEQFDLSSLISICNMTGTDPDSVKKIMYSGLENGNIPWIITALLEQGIWVNSPTKKQIQTIKECKELGVDSLKFILDDLSNGGGPDISKIENVVINQFANRPIEKMFVLSKHLCGNGFDLGLNSARNAVSEMRSGSKIVIIMSPCCHHRCLYTQHLGVDLLRELIPSVKPFESLEECFRFLVTISSWSTGASGTKSDYGFKAKYILDTCSRLFWLESNGFTNISYSSFTKKSVTPENILITAVFNKR